MGAVGTQSRPVRRQQLAAVSALVSQSAGGCPPPLRRAAATGASGTGCPPVVRGLGYLVAVEPVGLIRLGLVYRGRTLPLVWTMIDHRSSSVAFRAYRGLLRLAERVLPPGRDIVLLADRGFLHGELMAWIHRHALASARTYQTLRTASLCSPPGALSASGHSRAGR